MPRTHPNVIFLDVDGTLNDHMRFPNGYCGIKWKCVQNLNRIIAETDARLVISSAWRYLVDWDSMTLLGFHNLLLSHGVDCIRPSEDGKTWTTSRVIGTTCRDEEVYPRGQQIRHWLNENGGDRNYVVLDDGGDRPDESWDDLGILEAGHPVVWTNSWIGLSEDDANKAIGILKGAR